MQHVKRMGPYFLEQFIYSYLLEMHLKAEVNLVTMVQWVMDTMVKGVSIV